MGGLREAILNREENRARAQEKQLHENMKNYESQIQKAAAALTRELYAAFAHGEVSDSYRMRLTRKRLWNSSSSDEIVQRRNILVHSRRRMIQGERYANPVALGEADGEKTITADFKAAALIFREVMENMKRENICNCRLIPALDGHGESVVYIDPNWERLDEPWTADTASVQSGVDADRLEFCLMMIL